MESGTIIVLLVAYSNYLANKMPLSLNASRRWIVSSFYDCCSFFSSDNLDTSPFYRCCFITSHRYLEGGIESGFKKVQRGVYEKRLFHVKGKRNIRVCQVQTYKYIKGAGTCIVQHCAQYCRPCWWSRVVFYFSNVLRATNCVTWHDSQHRLPARNVTPCVRSLNDANKRSRESEETFFGLYLNITILAIKRSINTFKAHVVSCCCSFFSHRILIGWILHTLLIFNGCRWSCMQDH